jgi:hypothetical protein
MISDKLIEQVREFKELLISVTNRMIELKDENKTLREKNNELYETLMNNDSSLTEVKDLESDLRHKLKALEYRVEQLENENKTLNAELEDRDILIDEVKERESNLALENVELTNKVETAQKTIVQKDIIIEDLNTKQLFLKKELSERRDELFEKHNERNKLIEEKALLKNEVYQLKGKIERYPEYQDKAKKYDKLAEKAKIDEEEFLKKIDELKQLTYALEQEHAREKTLLGNEINEKERAIALLDKKLSDMSQANTSDANNYELEKEIEKLRVEIAEKEKEIKHLNDAGYGVLGQTLFGTMNFDSIDVKRENQEMGILQETILQKDKRIDLLVEENQEQKELIKAMEESNEKMEALVKKRYKQIQVLEEELSEAIHFKMRTREERLKLADKLEKYLRKLEYIIEN